MTVSVVIVNFKTPELTLDCLHSLDIERRRGCRIQVALVDNASPDNSVEVLSEAIVDRKYTSWVKLIPAGKNGGFAYGNNIGIRDVLGEFPDIDFFLLLNPDTIVRSGAINALVDHLVKNPRVGIVGSRLENHDETPQESAFKFPTIASEFIQGARLGVITRLLHHFVVAPPVRYESHPTDWVAGASMLIRTDVINQIGLLDDGYFMYYEEVDFCKRAQKAGWECWYIPESRVVHLVGQASGINSSIKNPIRRPDYVFESRRRYFLKHHGRFYAVLADLAWLTMYPLLRLRYWIQRKPNTDPPKLWWDMLRHSSLFRWKLR